jgi:hypothetical protein
MINYLLCPKENSRTSFFLEVGLYDVGQYLIFTYIFGKNKNKKNIKNNIETALLE